MEQEWEGWSRSGRGGAGVGGVEQEWEWKGVCLVLRSEGAVASCSPDTPSGTAAHSLEYHLLLSRSTPPRQQISYLSW